MLEIECPWCGPRDEDEFEYGREAYIRLPQNPDQLDDQKWGEYLYSQTNPKGIHQEEWVHRAGCRRWFVVLRDTQTYKIYSTRKIIEDEVVIEPKVQPVDNRIEPTKEEIV